MPISRQRDLAFKTLSKKKVEAIFQRCILYDVALNLAYSRINYLHFQNS